jgi:23S rRNA (cytosine1962-C5)-methyltransferase
MLVSMSTASALPALPTPSGRRLAVHLTPDALRQLRGGHPWVYDGSIVDVRPEGVAGELAVVFDRRRRFAGIGLYDPASPIRVKMLHHGRPTTIDEAWFGARIDAALDRRATLVDPRDGPLAAMRLVNGENDGLPALVVDRYADVLVVKLYSGAWWPWLRVVLDALQARTQARAVVLRTARLLRAGAPIADRSVVAGHLPAGPVRFSEAGLRFEADVRAGQKTGHFLDQRGNRILVGDTAGGLDVLDVFCSTGGFSVHAAAGGARRVHAIDASRPALDAATRNMSLNEDRPAVSSCRYSTEAADAFRAMERLSAAGERFDLVVVDPPSFAARRDQVDGARRAYARLTALGCGLLRRDGLLVQASCSSRVGADQFYETVVSAAAAGGWHLREILRTGHEPDHPIGFPEGAYLKAGFWRVGRR